MVVSKCLNCAKLLEFSKRDDSLLILGCTRAAAVQLLIFYMSTRKGCETVLFFGLCIGTTCAHSTVFVASTFSTECTVVTPNTKHRNGFGEWRGSIRTPLLQLWHNTFTRSICVYLDNFSNSSATLHA